MAKISKDMIIADLVKIDQNIVPILMREGMHCIGCPSAQKDRKTFSLGRKKEKKPKEPKIKEIRKKEPRKKWFFNPRPANESE